MVLLYVGVFVLNLETLPLLVLGRADFWHRRHRRSPRAPDLGGAALVALGGEKTFLTVGAHPIICPVRWAITSDESGGCWLIRRPQLTAKVQAWERESERESERGREREGASVPALLLL